MEAGTVPYIGQFPDAKIFQTSSVSQTVAAVKSVIADPQFETIVIDPITIFWEALIRKWNKIFLARNQTGKGYKSEYYDLQVSDWSTIKDDHSAFLRLLISTRKHVVVTAGAKDKRSGVKGEFMKVIGTTWDGEKRLDRSFDTVLRLRQKRGEVIAITEKDRTYSLPDDGPWECSYQEVAEAFGFTNRAAAPNKRKAPIRRK